MGNIHGVPQQQGPGLILEEDGNDLAAHLRRQVRLSVVGSPFRSGFRGHGQTEPPWNPWLPAIWSRAPQAAARAWQSTAGGVPRRCARRRCLERVPTSFTTSSKACALSRRHIGLLIWIITINLVLLLTSAGTHQPAAAAHPLPQRNRGRRVLCTQRRGPRGRRHGAGRLQRTAHSQLLLG